MNNKTKETLKQFKPIERNLIKKYYELWNIHESICNLWNINSEELNQAFKYVKEKSIPMYENNSSFMKVLQKYNRLMATQ
jgi:hypothetical protein